MKKLLLVTATFVFVSISAQAGLRDLYNKIDTNTNENSTIVDQKAADLKKKIQSKTEAFTEKYESKSTAEQESIKEKLEEKLANLVAKGEEKSEKALQIQAEIASLTKLIEAAKK